VVTIIYHYDESRYKYFDDLSHNQLFELFKSIPSDTESIIEDESDFEDDVINNIIELGN